MKKGSVKRSVKSKWAAIVLALSLLLGLLPLSAASAAPAANPEDTLIGAIRWDAWVGDLANAGLQVERSLGPNKYHFRLPFFGTEVSTDSVTVRETAQAVMDQDIAYAKSMGLDYWAYVYYEDNTGLDLALDLHLTSAKSNEMNWCYVIERGRLTTANVPQMVTRMQLSNYQTVNGGHPLVYLFDDANWTNATLDILRNAASAAGLPSLYIVYMGWSGSGASSMASTLSCQAISAYCTTGNDGIPYRQLAQNEVSKWDEWKNTGTQVVPFVTTGWDPRPRIDNPVSWATYNANNWVQTATPSEIAEHLQESLEWTSNHQSSTEANTVLMYAWNEFDEGGWICPTLLGGTERIDAIRDMLGSVTQNSGFENGTEGWSAQDASISVNTNANTLSNPGFESGTTGWSAQSCTLSADSGNAFTGTYACLASSRTGAWGSPYQSVKTALDTYGQGTYNATVQAKFASGGDSIRIVMKINDSNGDRWFSGTPVYVGTEYRQLSANMNITWTGTLNSAILYVQSYSSTTSLYLDDFTFTQKNLLANPGFESGTGSWSAQACTLTADTANKRTGTNACLVSSRSAYYGSPVQDIKNTLLANGQGSYSASVWVKFSSGSNGGYIVVKTNDGTGTHYFTGSSSTITTDYTQLTAALNITWSGTLNSAVIYFQTPSVSTSLYADDFTFTANAQSGTNSCLVYNRSSVTGSVVQDIKTALLANGQGSYTATAWAKFVSGSDDVSVVIKINDSTGDHTFTTDAATVGTSFTQTGGLLDITWTGTLNSAVAYMQSSTSTASMVLDEFVVALDTRLWNPSFESGTGSWSAQSCTLSADSGNAYTGSYACLASSRAAAWGSPYQDIKNALLQDGQGKYTADVWTKFASGTDNISIVIKINDSTGNHWFTAGTSSVGTTYTHLWGTMNITWSGTLNSAMIYVQSSSSTANLYLDDFGLIKN